MVLELLAYLFNSTYKYQIQKFYLKNMVSVFIEKDKISTRIMNFLQNYFCCCGNVVASDYQNITIPASCYLSKPIPASCYFQDFYKYTNLTSDSNYTKDCYAVVIENAKKILPVIEKSLCAAIFFNFFVVICTLVLCARNKAHIEPLEYL